MEDSSSKRYAHNVMTMRWRAQMKLEPRCGVQHDDKNLTTGLRAHGIVMVITTGLSVLSRSVLSPTLNVSLHDKNVFCNNLAHFQCFFNNESPRSFMCRFNVGILAVFRYTCLDYTRFNNWSHRSFRRNSFFVKRINVDLLRTGRFSSILHGSRVVFSNGSPDSLTTWTWNCLVRLETST